MGGLFDALRYLGFIFITPIAAFLLQFELLVKGFRRETSSGNITSFPKISDSSKLKRFCCRKLGSDADRYSKMLHRAESKVRSELDLIKFIKL